MGDKKLPEDDGKWNEIFRRKIARDMERKQIENEVRLEEAEAQRVLKLKLLGILKDEQVEEEKRRRKGRKKKHMSPAERFFERRKERNHTSLFRPDEDIETQMEVLHKEAVPRKKKNEKRKPKDNYNYTDDDKEEDDDRNHRYTSDQSDDDGGKEKRGNGRESDGEDEEGDESCDEDGGGERRNGEGQDLRDEYMKWRDDRPDDVGDQEYGQNLPTYLTHLGRTQAVEKREVHAGLERLYEEEDLDELYREAASLVSITSRKATDKGKIKKSTAA